MASPLQRGIAYSSMAKNVKADPFSKLEIKDDSFLNTISGRDICANCYKSRKFYCYSCYIPTDSVKNLIPFVELPFDVDVIKHPCETDGKSTAVHAAVIAPNNVRILTYPDVPDYQKDGSDVTLPEEEEGPVQFEVAKVIPLHKGGCKADIQNWRPISILHIFSEILEKVVHKLLYNFLQMNR
ncbi:hypothetical protein QYM36_000682, partial [Artemia franciscana]